MPRKLVRPFFASALDDFTIDGPKGTHLCCVSQPGDPDLSAILYPPGGMAATQRSSGEVLEVVATVAKKTAKCKGARQAKPSQAKPRHSKLHLDIAITSSRVPAASVFLWPVRTVSASACSPVSYCSFWSKRLQDSHSYTLATRPLWLQIEYA